jgi:hypothetical protein
MTKTIGLGRYGIDIQVDRSASPRWKLDLRLGRRRLYLLVWSRLRAVADEQQAEEASR